MQTNDQNQQASREEDTVYEPDYLDLIKDEFQGFKDLILNDESITLEETKNICDQVMNYIYGVLMISPLLQ